MKKALFLLPLLLAACGGSNGGQPQPPTAEPVHGECRLDVAKLLAEEGKTNEDVVVLKSHCPFGGGEHTTKDLEHAGTDWLEVCTSVVNKNIANLQNIQLSDSFPSSMVMQRPKVYQGKLGKFVRGEDVKFLDENDKGLAIHSVSKEGRTFVTGYELFIDTLPMGETASICTVHGFTS